MSWKNQILDGKSKRVCKIRKRGCSSSSSSSLVRKYRVKRAILAGKRAGSTTPIPSWKTGAKSPSLAMLIAEFPKNPQTITKAGSISARKLAASLWEMNKIPSHPEPEAAAKMERSRGNTHRRRNSVVSQKLGSSDSISNASISEGESHSRGRYHIKTRLKDVSNGLTTSKEILKVLNHMLVLEDKHSSALSLVSALRAELDRTRSQVNQVIQEQRSHSGKIECLVKQFGEEKAVWRRKERERIRASIASVAGELEVERKLRRQTERLNKKLGKELADTKLAFSMAMEELEGEKRAKEILEQVCDELARGLGEDRTEVEELKRESEKAREEVEKEREMLQLADVLREERVQMKLSEAKHDFEEKNEVVEKLRNELEAYLRTKEGDKEKESLNGSPNLKKIKELEAYLKKINFGSSGLVGPVEGVWISSGPEENGDGGYRISVDSIDSDLHSIELHMDNTNMSYKWSYVSAKDVQGDSKRNSIEKEKGRKPLSERIPWENICSERLSDIASENQIQGDDNEEEEEEEEIRRYKSVKSLRDSILSSSKIVPVQSLPSPTRKWGDTLHFQDSGIINSPVLQKMDDLNKF